MADLILAGEVSRDEVMLAAVKFLKEWEPEPGAGRRLIGEKREMVLRTRRPDDWVLTDKVTGRAYVWRNDGWQPVE